MLRLFYRDWFKFTHQIGAISDFRASTHTVSIGIGTTGPDQRHCGILYKRNNSVRFLHHAWHNQLLDHDDNDALFIRHPNFIYIPVSPSLPPEKLTVMIGMCKLIYDNNHEKGIPYGFRFGKTKFELAAGLLELDGKSIGLTCATFVIAVFEASRIIIVRRRFWPPRPGDIAWRKKIVEMLTATNVGLNHVNNVKAEPLCSRFRPEEVAAMGSKKNLPSDFFHATIIGKRILNFLER